ncbi:MAG: hypothetical protein WEC75_05440 [Dehalococcoidia bacterium]
MVRRRGLLVALAGAVVLAVVAGGVAMAQSGENGGQSFLDRVASKLGIERSKLDQAIEDARSDEIDEAVQSGDLSHEQADSLKERLDQLPEDFGGFRGGPGFQFRFGMEQGGFKSGIGFGDADLAEFLGITQEQLREELSAEDATLATVAEAHEKSRDELKAFLSAGVTEKLDAAVADGTLAQERADEIAANHSEMLDNLIDGNGLLAGWFGFDIRRGIGPGHAGGFNLEGVAEFLGIPQEQFREELAAEGATLASMAQAHGKGRDDLKAFLNEQVKTKLDALVADGRITQTQADEKLAAYGEGLDALIDGEAPFGRFRRFGSDGDMAPGGGAFEAPALPVEPGVVFSY